MRKFYWEYDCPEEYGFKNDEEICKRTLKDRCFECWQASGALKEGKLFPDKPSGRIGTIEDE